MKRFDVIVLRRGLIKLLSDYCVPLDHAEILIDCMLQSDMRGVHTHGLTVLPTYLKKIEQGGFEKKETCTILKSTPCFTTVDANNLLGMVSAKQCMDIAVSKCKDMGFHVVFCRNANTFGPAFYYTKIAVDQKLIGACCCNSPAAMPTWGGSKRILGTNPFSIGIPCNQNSPIIIDMATSVVAKSKINEIRKKGEELPEGWAVDQSGRPTTDPVEAINGMVLPMAGHKGAAIAMAIDIVAGVLSGAGYQNGVNRFYSDDHQCMNVGQCFVAIDPVSVLDDSFFDKMDDYVEELHKTGSNVRYPGERGNQEYVYSLKNGIELLDETVSMLSEIFLSHSLEEFLVENERR